MPELLCTEAFWLWIWRIALLFAVAQGLDEIRSRIPSASTIAYEIEQARKRREVPRV